MIYQYKSNVGFFLAMLTIINIFLLISIDIGSYSYYPLYILIGLVVYQILLALVRFNFILDADTIEYSIKLLNFVLYKKRFTSNEIESIKIKRTGLKTKTAVIKPKEGISIRLTGFQPSSLYKELINFAEKNRIEY